MQVLADRTEQLDWTTSMQSRPRRIAAFLDAPTFGNAAFVREPLIALAKAGINVDVYRPSSKKYPEEPVDGLPVNTIDFQTNSYRELIRFVSKWSAGGYDLYLGTPPYGLILAALMGKLHRKKTAAIVELLWDEKRFSNPTLRRLMAWSHRRSSLTIMTDACRIAPFRSYTSLPQDHRFFELPGCPAGELDRTDYSAIRKQVRDEWNIPQDASVLLYMGVLNEQSHLSLLFDAIPMLPANTYVVFNSNGTTGGETLEGLCKLAERSCQVRFVFNPRQYSEIYRVLYGADIGIAFYNIPSLNARYLGKGSNKLCMYLRAHLPVLVSRIGSLDWVDERRCGKIVDAPQDIPRAVEEITRNYSDYVQAARIAYEEEVRFERFFPPIQSAIMEMLN